MLLNESIWVTLASVEELSSPRDSVGNRSDVAGKGTD